MELITPTLPNQHPRLKFTYTPGWTQSFLLISDCHIDSPECQLDILIDHLDEAKERDALILYFGDFFDVINSRDDHRRSMASLRDENKVDAYVDSVIDFALGKFGKYADQFILFGRGNHESKLTKLCGTDITRRFIDELNRLRSPGLPPIYRGEYGGWLRMQFARESGSGCFSDRSSINLKYFHGSGGGAEVTKGVMEVQRWASAIDAADIMVTGHTHNGWIVPHLKEAINDLGIAYTKPLTHIKISGYKQDYRLNGAGTWAMQRGFKPAPIGGAWLELKAVKSGPGYAIERSVSETRVNYSRVA